MKKSLSKKILAMFLAVLMLVTAVPFTSFAATESDLSNLNSAMAEYEKKMNGTIYTNMKVAYDAYIKARELKDAYVSGQDSSVDLAKATSELTAATAAMGQYVEPTVQYVVPAWFGDSTPINENSKNIIFADTTYNRNTSVGTTTWNGDDFINEGIQYGTTVLLYDGLNTPQFPVMCSVSREGGKSIIRRLLSVFPAETATTDEKDITDNSSFRISSTNGYLIDKSEWPGGRTGGNNDYAYNYTHDSSGSDSVQYIGGATTGPAHWTNNLLNYNTYYFSSSLKYKNTMKPNEYTLDFQIPWILKAEYGQKPFYHSYSTGSMVSDIHTYVVNYKAVKDAITLATGAGQLSNVGAYNEHWAEMSNLMNAIDTATSFDVNSYDYAADTAAAIKKCNADIKTIVEGIEIGVKISKDTPSYEKLRNTIDMVKKVAENGNGTQEDPIYTTETWTRFENAYKAAVEEMKGLPTNHYNVNGVTDIEKELSDAYKGLNFFKQASFIAYNIARDELVQELGKGNWTAKSLDSVKEKLANIKYFEDSKQVNIPASEQTIIDSETELFKQAKDLLKVADNSVFESMKVTIKTINADSSNVAEVQKEFDRLSANTTRVVNVLGTDYTGYTYDEIVSGTITKVNETKYDYKIKVVDEANNTTKYVVMDAESKAISYTEDEKQATKFHYDDKLTLTNDVACDWAVTVVAQSTATESIREVVNTNSTSYEFSVRGNTTIYLSSATSASSHKVTFVDSRSNEVVAFGYTSNGTFDISSVNVPNYAYYDIKGYECSTESVKIEGTQITGITSDITVTVNYAPSESVGEYTVRFEDAFGAVLETKTVKYNQLVTLTKEGSKYFTDKATDKVLWTGDTYSFYACQNITVVAHADDKALETVDVSVSKAPIESNGITRFVGSFAQVPSRYKVLNYGVVVDFDNRYANDLSLAKVNKAEKVYNLSASSYDAKSNQFVVGVTGTYTNINYVSYLICEDTTTGYRQIFYSNIVHA